MFAQPNTTPYDLRFRMLGVPIRVHPGFWIVGLLLGFDQSDPKRTMVWVAVLLASILWHEMGHALASKWQGLRPSVVLYWMGGLCYSERGRLPLGGRVAVILGGPGAGFVLGMLTAVVGYAAAGLTAADDVALFKVGTDEFFNAASKFDDEYVYSFYKSMLFLNFGWTLVNLLPIWSLDGGQFLGEVLTRRQRHRGMRQTHIVGIATAALVALWAFSNGDQFLALFFALFAFSNVQGLRALQAGYGAAFDDPSDWWKRGR